MQPYLITLGKGLKGPARINGALFLGERALYFVGLSVGLGGSNDFSPLGPIGAAIEGYKKTGAPPVLVEAEVAALAAATPNSYALAPEQIALLSRSMWSGSKIVLKDGEKLVVWAPGFGGQFRDRTRAWAQARSVPTKGL
jgi:hypothetical protein